MVIRQLVGTKTNGLRATGTLSQLKLTVYITIITVINNYLNSHKVVKLTRGGKE